MTEFALWAATFGLFTAFLAVAFWPDRNGSRS